MKMRILHGIFYVWACFFPTLLTLQGQEVPIEGYDQNINGQVQLKIASNPQTYYLLQVRHHPQQPFETTTSMTLGNRDTTIITEPLSAYPLSHYRVLGFPTSSDHDIDGDSWNDFSEFSQRPGRSPLNAAQKIDLVDGVILIEDVLTFKKLSENKKVVLWSEFLNGKTFTKFIITRVHSQRAEVYFINGSTYDLHTDFAEKLGIDLLGTDVVKGQIIFLPATFSTHGVLGTYAFNYSNGHGDDFSTVQRTHELLAANMPFLKNNLSYFVTSNSEDEYKRDSASFAHSRIDILFEKDIFNEVDYWGLNPAEGYGRFRKIETGEIPATRDIVLYESLPNSLPRVGGIITSALQTPLSHVNLRAIQDGIPNAFIRAPLSIDSIANLLGEYVYFKVAQDKYTLRKASQSEVDAWFKSLRPDTPQLPPLNLQYTAILPLKEIEFSMFDGYGVKCANVATMLSFDFPEGTIPEGYGIPFYFYREFMRYNGFFDEVKSLLADPEFLSDRSIRDEKLEDFRKKVRKGDMPDWMMKALEKMQNAFPEGTAIRCRSSTNNEDLPNFNGAGLYTSKTQHPDEGHISKSIKQVYASLWNLSAFDEREFYRIDHFQASMGVLCHQNYSLEKANGVGVTTDPVYNTDNTFYLNSQLGEDLITNPDALSHPEEILLDQVPVGKEDHIVIRRSNQVPQDSLILSEHFLQEMRDLLTVVHDRFKELYEAEEGDGFAMEVEYKITQDDRLIIKQARPWASFSKKQTFKGNLFALLQLRILPNPAPSHVQLSCDGCGLSKVRIFTADGRHIEDLSYSQGDILSVGHLPRGTYLIQGISDLNDAAYIGKLVKL